MRTEFKWLIEFERSRIIDFHETTRESASEIDYVQSNSSEVIWAWKKGIDEDYTCTTRKFESGPRIITSTRDDLNMCTWRWLTKQFHIYSRQHIAQQVHCVLLSSFSIFNVFASLTAYSKFSSYRINPHPINKIIYTCICNMLVNTKRTCKE